MRAQVRDNETLSSLKPLEIASYLRSSGWIESEQSRNGASTWHKDIPGEGVAEITLPMNARYRDFAVRAAEVLQALEAVEDRPQTEILEDLFTASSDVIRLRLIGPDHGSGSIPLNEGAKAAQKAYEMVLSAACAAIDARRLYQTRKPDKAVEYVRRARMGQTDRGSYVLTIISRVAPALRPGDADDRLFELEDPFERRVTATLANALAAVEHAAQSAATTGELTGFEHAVQHGVSANLCDAIAGLGTSEEYRNVEVSFSWSRSRPVPGSQPSRVTLSSDAIPVIAEAGRYFRESEPWDDFELRGPVVKLERSTNDAEDGIATVLTFVEGQPRKVRAELDGNEYQIAIRAHENHQTVRGIGTLFRSGRSFVLKDVRAFVAEEDPEER